MPFQSIASFKKWDIFQWFSNTVEECAKSDSATANLWISDFYFYSPWTEYHRLPNSGWVLVRIVVVRWTWHYGIPLWSARENNSRKRGLSIPPTEWPSTKTSTVEGKREDNNKIRYIVQLEWRGHTVKVRFIVVVKLHLYGRQGKVSLISCQKIWEVFLQGLKK